MINIGIIGAGSIGSLFGGYIANIKSKKNKISVYIFGRKYHIERINLKGLKLIIPPSNKITINNLISFINIKDYLDQYLKYNIKFDFLILSTKAYDIEKTLQEYSDLLKKTTFLVLLQNGIGNEIIAKKFISESKIIRMITSHGANLIHPGKIVHTGTGFTKIGYPFKKKVFEKYGKEQAILNLERFKNLLDLAGINTSIVPNINIECWEKAFINIGINSIGTLCRLKNGALLENQNIKNLMKETILEAIKVAKLKKINLSNNDFVESCFNVALMTKDNINSMLQDILKGKKTEIDFLNGKVVQYANELDFQVPINELLTSLIKGLEQSKI